MDEREVLHLLEAQDGLRCWLEDQAPLFLQMMIDRSQLGVNKFAAAYGVSPAYISRCKNGIIPMYPKLATVLLREYFDGK